jgi:HAD superfamily hydrolase (TIGR01509 family)
MNQQSLAIIFDMDGVIINSEKLWAERETDFVQTLIPSFPKSAQQKLLGRSTLGVFKFLRAEFNLTLPEQEFLKEYKKFGLKNIYEKCKLISNILVVLQKISQQKKIALASSSPRVWIEKIFERFNLEKFFNVVVSADDINGKGKPAPDIFLYAAKKLKVKPKKCLVIEDSENGILAGKRANMTVFGFRNGWNHDQNFSQADKIIADFSLFLN